jgi:hypothetical protein
MTESSEAFFINKCSSMSFKELGEYIALCFEYLENPQKHLANAKKAPVLKETYGVLIDRLESKLSKIVNLFTAKNEFEFFSHPKVASKTLDQFDTLEHYYLETASDKNEILQKKQTIEKLLLVILKIVFSETNIASIYVNSSEPFHKILSLLNALSESNDEIRQVLIRYKFSEFQNLFSETLAFNPYKLIAFSYSFWNTIKFLIQTDFRLNARHTIDLKEQIKLNEAEDYLAEGVNKLEQEWKHFEESRDLYRVRQRIGFHINHLANNSSLGKTHKNDLEKLIDYEKNSRIRLDNLVKMEIGSRNWLSDSKYEQREKEKKRRKSSISFFREVEVSDKKYSNQFINLFEALSKEGITQIHKNSKSKLDDILIQKICEESNWELRLRSLLNLENVWTKILKETRTDSKDKDKPLSEAEIEKNEFRYEFTESLDNFLENIIIQINSDLDKYIQSEEIDSDLEFSKLVVENLKESRNRIFVGSTQKMIVKEIFWDLLPQGEWKTEGLIKTFKGYGWSKDEFDESRLTQIIKILKPTICYIGKEKFQGYVVFGFDSTEKVVMECPKYGNAIYIK